MPIESRDEHHPEHQANNMMGNVMGAFNLLAWPRKPIGPGINKGKGKSGHGPKFQNRGSNQVRSKLSRGKKNSQWD
jgi:hypothetical protein